MGPCVLGEWVVEGGGHFGEQRLPVGIQECLERLHRGCVDNLSRQFVPELLLIATGCLLPQINFIGIGSRKLTIHYQGCRMAG